MKKITRLICFLTALSLVLCTFAGCKKKTVQNSQEKTENKKSEEIQEEAVKYNSSTERPIAVMIDNDGKDSWPHSGLEDAYLIYEMYVEGGFTRLMALYRGKDTKKIGPVRSSRHYFLDYVFEHDAFYVAYGVSPKASEDIKELNVETINGVLGGSGYFWRERKYKNDYHSAYISMENIKKGMADKGIRTQSDEKFMEYNTQNIALLSDVSAKKIVIPYNYAYKVTYEYDEASQKYKRTMNESTVHQSPDGVLYAPVNIILQEVTNYSLNDSKGRQDLKTVGSGNGKYITCGKTIDITWQKNSRREKTVYKDVNGKEIILNPGLTFINIVPPSMKNLIIE